MGQDAGGFFESEDAALVLVALLSQFGFAGRTALALCTHIGIIHYGRLVACGAIEELRAGVAVAAAEAETGPRALTLQQIFLHVVGGARAQAANLSWL